MRRRRTSRGNYRSALFREEGARLVFLACLDEACEKAGWRVQAWCVMTNHFHLALETPRGNLVAGMQWLQSTFALRFNRYRRDCGHLFQGRYKSLLVGLADGLGALCHYLHLNPVRAPSIAWRIGPGAALAESRTARLEKRLDELLAAMGKKRGDLDGERKSAPWKVALAAEMKASTTATNQWLADALAMGSPFQVSRLASAGRVEPGAAAPFLRGMARRAT